MPDPEQSANTLILTASYTDAGGNGVKPLTGAAQMALSGNRISPNPDMEMEGMQAMAFGGMDLALLNANEGHLRLEGYDLTGVRMLILEAGWQTPPAAGADFELRLGSPDGEIIGQGSLTTPQQGQGTGIPVMLSAPQTGKQMVYLTYKREKSEDPGMIALVGIQFR